MELSNLEVALIVLSVTETIISAYAWRKWKKRLDAERILYETKRTEYERLIEALPTGRNTL